MFYREAKRLSVRHYHTDKSLVLSPYKYTQFLIHWMPGGVFCLLALVSLYHWPQTWLNTSHSRLPSPLLVLKQEMAIITKQNNKTRLQPKLNLQEDLALCVRHKDRYGYANVAWVDISWIISRFPLIVFILLTSQYDENDSEHLLGCPGACIEPWWHGSLSPYTFVSYRQCKNIIRS